MKIKEVRLKIWSFPFVFWIIILLPMCLFSQQKKVIRPLPTQTEKELILNPEYEKALVDYEELIKKYPDKKELYFNLGNLNYINGDSKSALQNYQNSLKNSDSNAKADALYNIGNTYYQMGDLQNSVDFFKKALSFNPNDEDIRYNYELSKRMLEQQPPQDSKEDDGQKDQENQQSQNGDKNEQDKNSKNSETADNENEDKQSEDGEENVEEGQEQAQEQDKNEKNEEAQKQKTESQIQAEKEKQLGKEEAEAILNALKADANNLKPRQYKSKGLIKLEKDW